MRLRTKPDWRKQPRMSKKLYIKTYGCQMNVYDSLRMADVLAPFGYSETSQQEEADMVILNTCHIREKASEKVYSELGRLRIEKEQWAQAGKRKLIAVAGCVAQAEGEEILSRAPYVDVLVGPQTYQNLPDLIAQTLRSSKAQMALEFSEEQKFDVLPDTYASQGVSAFVSIQEGCDKFCTFCVVPYTRGAEFSRPVAAIEREVRTHVAQGACEITLLGQNVNAYHGEDEKGNICSLAQLIACIARIDGVKRIRYTTSHPKDMRQDLIDAHADIPQLMPFLHLPVQSGADRILKAMNRKHSADFYIDIIEKLRKARPDMAFSSDFIVGFPGETQAEHEASLRLIETIGFSQAYSFKYSSRPGTPAADFEDTVPEQEKNARLAAMQTLLFAQQNHYNARSVGKIMPVLFDRLGKGHAQLLGKSPYMQSVHVENAVEYAQRLVDVRITAAYGSSVRGEIIGSSTMTSLPETPTSYRDYGQTAHG